MAVWGPWTPGRIPTSPPIGSYDPTLDANARSANRGLADFMSDAALAGVRRTDDYELAKDQLGAQEHNTLEDIMRRYRVLGQRQTTMARQQGVDEGGTLHQSAQARGRNQGRETTRTEQAYDQRLGQLGLAYGRANADSTLARARASREAGFYQQDVGAARWAQAAQSGFALPAATMQHTSLSGTPYRVVSVGGRTMYSLPNGTLLSAPPG